MATEPSQRRFPFSPGFTATKRKEYSTPLRSINCSLLLSALSGQTDKVTGKCPVTQKGGTEGERERERSKTEREGKPMKECGVLKCALVVVRV
jgi:hypothetical protein